MLSISAPVVLSVRMAFEYNHHSFMLCVAAKAGSTSLTNMFQTQWTGHERAHNCAKNLQSLVCWNDVPGLKIWRPSNDATFKGSKRPNLIYYGGNSGPQNITFTRKNGKPVEHPDFSLLITRDPVHRALSSWENRIRHQDCMPAGLQKSEIPQHSYSKEPSQPFAAFLEEIQKTKTRADAAAAAAKRNGTNTRNIDVVADDAHWTPQFVECGPKENYMHKIDLYVPAVAS